MAVDTTGKPFVFNNRKIGLLYAVDGLHGHPHAPTEVQSAPHQPHVANRIEFMSPTVVANWHPALTQPL